MFDGNGDITQRITIDDQATPKLDQITGKLHQMGETSAKAGERARDGADTFDRGLIATLGSVRTLAISMLGPAGLIEALQKTREEMRLNADAAKKLKEAQVDLQFLSQNINSGELELVRSAAAIKGGPNAEVDMTNAYAKLKSQTAGLDDQQRVALFQQLVETSVTTSAPASSLVELFTKTNQYIPDVNRLQNVLRQTQIQSPEASPQALAQLLPRILGVGESFGLTPEQTAGMFATAANVSGSSAEAATAVKGIILALSGKGTPEGQALAKQLGFTDAMNPLQRMDVMGEALRTGKINAGQVQGAVGEGNIATMLGLLRNPAALTGNIRAIEEAGASSRDLTAEAIQNILSQDRAQALRVMIAQSQAREASKRARDTESLEFELEQQRINEATVGSPNLGYIAKEAAFYGKMADDMYLPYLIPGVGMLTRPARAGGVSGALRNQPNVNVTNVNINQQFNNGASPHQRTGRRNPVTP